MCSPQMSHKPKPPKSTGKASAAKKTVIEVEQVFYPSHKGINLCLFASAPFILLFISTVADGDYVSVVSSTIVCSYSHLHWTLRPSENTHCCCGS